MGNALTYGEKERGRDEEGKGDQDGRMGNALTRRHSERGRGG